MIAQILSHPFTLLLVGALLTGVLAPRLLRGWQDGAKSLELKAAMVEDIAKSTETFFSRLQLIELKGEAAVTSLDEALTDWRTSYAVLDAEISTYFPFSDALRREWGQVGAELWTTYFLLANNTPAKREAFFKESVLLFGDDPEAYRTLIDVSITHVGSRKAEYDFELQKLLDTFRFHREKVLHRLLSEHAQVRSSPRLKRFESRAGRRQEFLPHPRGKRPFQAR